MPPVSRNRVQDADLFRPVKVGRASEDVVRQIKQAIHAGTLKPGDALPSERELTERFVVSRVTVRDALRTLEAVGLLKIRVGSRGGAFVTAPEPDHVGEGLANMLALSATSPEEVTEARMIFELGAIPLVCERRTDEDLVALEDICTRAEQDVRESGEYDVRFSAEFHIRLASSSHNTAIAMIVDSFSGPLLMSLTRAKDVAPRMGKEGSREHRKLIEVVRKRDVGAAHTLMSRHLGRTATRLHTGRDTAESRAGR